MATDRSMNGDGANSGTSTGGFAPAGTTLFEALGMGTGFEVALVTDAEGRELVCKRSAPRARASAGDAALDRERELLGAAKSPHLVDLVTWGLDARGGFLLEGRARGVSVREL